MKFGLKPYDARQFIAERFTEIDRAIAGAVQEFLDTEIQDGMSDYEKELAAHDWIIDRAAYDSSVLDPIAPGDSPHNTDPYGALILGRGICTGYSYSFQLLMDALGIECITVYGSSGQEGELTPHSWNMVKLDGQWYYVDTAWDDPVDTPPHYGFFNQTAELFAEIGPHVWDQTGLPQAADTPYSPHPWD